MGLRGRRAFAGKIIRVNLSNGSISIEPTEDYAKEWLGASGIATGILYDEVKPWVTPYEPANRLVFGAGTLVGTLAPGASRMSAESINTLSGGFATSNCDSFFGFELKHAGYDTIVVQGKANTPVYLLIKDDHCEIKDASHLWNKTTWETLDTIRQEQGDNGIHIISIGPAGENLVRGACIIQDRGRALGRCGLGSVMGSKNLKAIAVKGTGAIEVADPERFMRAVDSARELFESSNTAKLNRQFGTAICVRAKQNICGIPYKNFQFLTIPDDMLENLDQEKLNAKYKIRNLSFPGCCVQCGRYWRVDDGPYAGFEGEGFQFEALADLNCKLGIDDPTFTIKANAYCNQLGLDIDLAAETIAWSMECYEKGILEKQDLDNLKVEWGDAGVTLELIRKIAYREGFGDILAEGVAKAAELVGRQSDYFAMHMKGQDLYEVIRGAIGWGLGCTTSTRGGGHTTGAPVCETIMAVDPKQAEKVYGIKTANKPLSYEGKAELVDFFEDLHRINNSLGICHYNTVWSDVCLPSFKELAELYSAATGDEKSVEDMRWIAKRQLNMEKAFNLLRTEFDRRFDYPTPRDLNEPIPTGNIAGWKIEKKKWDDLLDEYYEMHNWDKQTSYPTRKCLEELDLKKIADELEKVGKLGR